MKHRTGFLLKKKRKSILETDVSAPGWVLTLHRSWEIASLLKVILWKISICGEGSKVNFLCLFSEMLQKKVFAKMNIASSSCSQSGSNFCLRFHESTLQQSLFPSNLIEIRYQAFSLCMPAFPKKNPTIIQTAMRVSLCTLPNVMQIWRKHEIEILYEMSITLEERTLYSYENRGITNRISLNIQCVFFIEATQTASKADLRHFQRRGDGNRVWLCLWSLFLISLEIKLAQSRNNGSR